MEAKFLKCVQEGKLQKTKQCIEDGVNINCVSKKDKKTPFIIACEKGHFEIIKLLLANSANIAGIDKYGMTALHHSAFNGHTEVVKLLLDNNADIDVYDKANLTPLHEAASIGKAGVVRLLIKSGADINLADKDGKTALDLATEFGKKTCVKYLQKAVEKQKRKRSKRMIQSNTSDNSMDDGNNNNHHHQKRAATQVNFNGNVHRNKQKSNRKLNGRGLSVAESKALTKLNLFSDENNNSAKIESLESQNESLTNRVKKLQKEMQILSTKLSENANPQEIKDLKQRLKDKSDIIGLLEKEVQTQERDISENKREIVKLKKEILKEKHKNEKEKKKNKDITEHYEKRIKSIESKYAVKAAAETSKNDEDEGIEDIIDECGDDSDKLKGKLIEVMKILKKLDNDNEDLQREMNELKKKHSNKIDKLMNDYGAIRDELSVSSPPMSVDGGGDDDEKGKHMRKSSKILRKSKRFATWLTSEVALPQYMTNFRNHSYDRIDVVTKLVESDLKTIGISKIGHRRLIMEKIDDLNRKNDEKNLLHDVDDDDGCDSEVSDKDNENGNDTIKEASCESDDAGNDDDDGDLEDEDTMVQHSDGNNDDEDGDDDGDDFDDEYYDNDANDDDDD